MTRSSLRPTPAQDKARARSWRIFRLRGLHAQCHMLTGFERELALAAIDIELFKLGAESESKRQADIRRKWEIAE